MKVAGNRGVREVRCVLFAVVLLVVALQAPAQQQNQQNRERAQMMQMQQQLQRVQQDNADLQGKLQKKDEDLKKESEAGGTTRRQLSAARGEATAKGKELEATRADLDQARELLNAARSEIEQLKSVIARRDEALTQAGERERRGEQAQSLLGDRLKHQTARADRCETKHAGAMTFAGELVDLYQKDTLRLCEPITGLWKPRSENFIQELRSRLSTYELEAPVEASR